MSPAPHVPTIAAVGIAALIAWRLYARTRRLVGRQRLTRLRPWLSACLFPVLLLGLLIGAVAHPLNALAEVAGIALGVGLGVYGLRLTRFEATPAGLFYTPNAHIGIALSLLLIGRLGWRAFVLYQAGASLLTEPPDNLARSPLTVFIIGTLGAYYAAYAVGLLRWRGQLGRTA